uniref:Uncharacterized protein n=1 Tax=Magallana gigas TaxID=29159 RepID=A0A8W8JRB0_MAGGI
MSLIGSNTFLQASFLGFSIYISNTTDILQGKLCFKDRNFTLYTIPAVITVNCPIHGQYVIYYNERLPRVFHPDGYSVNAYNELCEVEVFGEGISTLNLYAIIAALAMFVLVAIAVIFFKKQSCDVVILIYEGLYLMRFEFCLF